MYRKYSKLGFTLIELVMVMLILGVVLTPLAVLFTNIAQKYSTAEVMQIATALAHQEMQQVLSKRFLEVVDEGPTGFPDFPNYSYEVIVTPNATNTEKTVEVRVLHDIVGSITLTSYVTKKVAQ